MKLRTLVLTPEQSTALEQIRDRDSRAYMRERAAALLKIAAGQSAHAVARSGLLRPRDPDTVYGWLNQYIASNYQLLPRLPSRKRLSP